MPAALSGVWGAGTNASVADVRGHYARVGVKVIQSIPRPVGCVYMCLCVCIYIMQENGTSHKEEQTIESRSMPLAHPGSVCIGTGIRDFIANHLSDTVMGGTQEL